MEQMFCSQDKKDGAHLPASSILFITDSLSVCPGHEAMSLRFCPSALRPPEAISELSLIMQTYYALKIVDWRYYFGNILDFNLTVTD